MLLDDIKQQFKANANHQKANEMAAYMRNKFSFYGIQSVARRSIQKDFYSAIKRCDKEDIETLVRQLWQLEQREYQYFAIDIIKQHRSHFNLNDLGLAHHLLTTKSWWDTVDILASNMVGFWVLRDRKQGEKAMRKYITSPNMWVRRTAIIHQLKYKDKTNLPLLFQCVDKTRKEGEFFIQKANGWALREAGKYFPDKVKTYLESSDLPALTNREARKHLG